MSAGCCCFGTSSCLIVASLALAACSRATKHPERANARHSYACAPGSPSRRLPSRQCTSRAGTRSSGTRCGGAAHAAGGERGRRSRGARRRGASRGFGSQPAFGAPAGWCACMHARVRACCSGAETCAPTPGPALSCCTSPTPCPSMHLTHRRTHAPTQHPGAVLLDGAAPDALGSRCVRCQPGCARRACACSLCLIA